MKGLSVNVLHYAADVGAPNPAAILAAYTNLAGRMPQFQKITVPSSGEIFEDTTGALLSVWSRTGGGVVNGAGSVGSAAGVGACIGWKTGAIVNSRHLRGRTFLCPLSVDAYQDDGTLTTAMLTNAQAVADGLRSAGPLGVWHRPTSEGAHDGLCAGVVAGTVRDHVAYLSSRRD